MAFLFTSVIYAFHILACLLFLPLFWWVFLNSKCFFTAHWRSRSLFLPRSILLHMWLFLAFTSWTVVALIDLAWRLLINKVLFFLATKKQAMSLEYFVNFCSLYCYCRSMLASKIVTFSPCNYDYEMILNIAESYSETVLKYCRRMCRQLY